jgi:hypothetical protein
LRSRRGCTGRRGSCSNRNGMLESKTSPRVGCQCGSRPSTGLARMYVWTCKQQIKL